MANGAFWLGQDGKVYVKGDKGVHAAGNWDKNTADYWASRGFQAIRDPNPPKPKYQQVKMNFNPTTNQVDIEAPDYYFNSPEYKNDVAPLFEQLKGKNLDNVQLGALLSDDIISQMQKQADTVYERQKGLNDFRLNIDKNATDEDYILSQRNIAASKYNDKDNENLITISVDKDGNEITQSIAETMEQFKKLDSLGRGNIVKIYSEVLSSDKATSKQKAAAYGMLGFMNNKGLTNSTKLAALGLAGTSFAAGTVDSLAGIANFFTLGKIDALNDVDLTKEFRQGAKKHGIGELEGASGAMSVGEFGGAAVPYLIPVSGMVGGVVKAGSKIPKIGGSISKISKAVDALEGGGLIAKSIRSAVIDAPSDILFGISKAGQGSQDYSLGETMLDVASNAVSPAIAKGVGRVVRPLADSDTIKTASRALSDYGTLGMDAFTKVPGIKQVTDVIRTIRGRGIDSATGIKRETRLAVSKSRRELAQAGNLTEKTDPLYKYYEFSNNINVANRHGVPLVNKFDRDNILLTKDIDDTAKRLESAGKMDDFDAYYVARTKLNDHKFGIKGGELSKEQLENFSDILIKHQDDPDFNDAYNAISVYARQFQDQVGVPSGTSLDIRNKQVQVNPDYAKNWAPLRTVKKDTKQVKKLTKRKPRDITPVHSRKGVAKEYQKAHVGLENYREEMARKAADNIVRTNLIELSDMGVGGIRVVADAGKVADRNFIKQTLKGEKEAIDNMFAATSAADSVAEKIIRQMEDIQDFSDEGAKLIKESVDELIDTVIKTIDADPRFKNILDTMTKDLGGDRRGAAREIIASYRKNFGDALQARLKEGLGTEQREFVKNIVDETLSPDARRLARATDAGFTVDGTDELGDTFKRSPESVDELGDQFQASTHAQIKERNEARKALDKELDMMKGEEGVISYYKNGTEGRIQVDDPLIAEFFNSAGQTEFASGHVAKLMELAARTFRAGIILNPIFPVKNLARDTVRSATTGTLEVLQPRTNLAVLMKGAGIEDDAARKILDTIKVSSGFTTGAMGRGEQGVGDIMSYLNKQKKVEGNVFTIGKEGFDKTLKLLEKPQDIIEEATRERVGAAAYVRALKQGSTEEQAMQAAKFFAAEATANFANHGSHVQQFIRTIPFMNAALQGSDSFYRLATLDPLGVAMRFATGIAAPVTYLTIHNLRDPEVAEAYHDIPEWEKRNNFIIMLDSKNRIQIPMDQELANWINPIVQSIEGLKGANRPAFETIADFAVGVSPLDVSGFRETGYEGGVNVGLGLSRLFDQFVPQLASPALSVISGKDAYTGNRIGPDPTLGDASEQTYESKNSRTLGWFADKLGIPQSSLQALTHGYGGAVGDMLINAIDTFAGAPEDQQGGKSARELAAGALFGRGYKQSETDFYNMVSKFEGKKKMVENKLEKLAQEQYFSNDPNSEAMFNKQREAIMDQYGRELADNMDKYGQFYQNVGGMEPFMIDKMVKLLMFAPKRGAVAEGDWQNQAIDDANTQARNRAMAEADRLGIQDTGERDRYGRLLYDEAGELMQDFSGTTRATGLIKNAYYDAPKQAAYEFKQAIAGNKRDKIVPLKNRYDFYRDRIDLLYDKVKNLQGTEKQAVYTEIEELQEAYMANEFDARIKPLIDKWGPGILTNNAVGEEIRNRIMVPGDFTPYFSRKKTPYLMQDVLAYVKDRYGVGKINRSNTPSDPEAKKIIERINADLSDGKTSAARFKFDNLRESVADGSVYVNMDIMNDISNKLNPRRK